MASSEMCSSISLDDQGWMKTVKIYGIPTGVTSDQLEEYFDDDVIGGPIDMICMVPESSVAEITFENVQDAERVLSHEKFNFKDTKLIAKKVTDTSEVDRSSNFSAPTEFAYSSSAFGGDNLEDSFIILPRENEELAKSEDGASAKERPSLTDLLKQHVKDKNVSDEMENEGKCWSEMANTSAKDEDYETESNGKKSEIKQSNCDDRSSKKVQDWLDSDDNEVSRKMSVAKSEVSGEDMDVMTDTVNQGGSSENEKDDEEESSSSEQGEEDGISDGEEMEWKTSHDRKVGATGEPSSGATEEPEREMTECQVKRENTVEEPKHRIIVYDYDEDLDPGDIEAYFEKKVGPVSQVQEMPGAKSIIITFKEDTDGLRTLDFGVHHFASKTFNVRPFEMKDEACLGHQEDFNHEEADSVEEARSVVLMGIPDDLDESDLEVLLGSPKRGGGPVESIDIHHTDDGVNAMVTFKDAAVARKLLDKGYHMLLKHKVTLMPYKARDEHVVEVIGVEDREKENTLLYFFESPRNHGGPIQHIDFDPEKQTFILKFSDSEVARGLVGKSFELQDMQFQVQWPSLTFQKGPVETLVEECGPVSKNRKTVIVHNVGDPSKVEGLLYFFESPRNNGGTIENIQFNEGDGTVTIEFQDENVAQNFIGQTYNIEGTTILVSSHHWNSGKGHAQNGNKVSRAHEKGVGRSCGHGEKTGTSGATAGMGNNTKQSANSRGRSLKGQEQCGSLSLDEEMEKMAQMDCTVRVKVEAGTPVIKKDTLKRYAENTKRSGGGPIQSFNEMSCDTYEIRFKDEHVAASFLSRQHTVQGRKLIVQPLASSEFIRGDLPTSELEPQKILLKWSQGATVTRDDLLLYLADVMKSNENLKISYVPKPYTAMVELTEEWDADILARRFKVTPFVEDGSVNITASPLKKPTIISLPELKVDPSLKIALQYYFENPAKGGDERCQVDFSTGVAIVRCPNNEVAQQLADKTHQIDDKFYCAELVYEELGVIPAEFDRNSAFIEPPSSIVIDNLGEKSKFFTCKHGLEYVNMSLEYAEVDLKYVNHPGCVKVTCHIKKDIEDYQRICQRWEAKVKEVIKNIADSVTVCEVPALQKTWVHLKEQIKPSLDDADTICLVELVESKKMVKLIGLKDEAKRLKSTVEDTLEKITKQLESTDHEEDFKPLFLECLQKKGFLDKVKTLPNVKIRPGTKANSLIFTGCGNDVLKVSRQVRKEIDSLHEETVNVSKNVAYLMKKPSFVEKFMEKESLKGTLVKLTGDNKLAIVGTKHQVDEAKKALQTSISEFQVFFREESKSLIGTNEWSALIAKVEGNVGEDMFAFQNIMKDLRIEVACFTSDRTPLKKAFINFFNLHTVWEERIALPEGKMQILVNQFENELKAVPQKVGSSHASVTPSKSVRRKGLIIKGNQDDLKKIRTYIDDILCKLHLHKERVTGAGAKALKQETGKYFRMSLERECEVHVELVESDSAKNGFETRKNGVTVKVVVGTMDEYTADVLVDPANEDMRHSGGLAKVLADSGGPIVNSDSLYSVKAFGKVKIGEVRVTSGGMLPCRVLYHTVGPQFKNGQTDSNSEKELHTATTKCLERAAKDGFRSIALPLISAGQYGGPMHVVAKIMAKAVTDFVNNQALHGNLHEIVLIDVDNRKIDEVVKALQGSFGGAYSKQQPGFSPPMARKEMSQQRKDVGDRIELTMDEMKHQKVEAIVNSVPQDCDLYQGPLSKSIMDCLMKSDQQTIQTQIKRGAPLGEGEFISTDGGGKWLAIYHCRLCSWDGGPAKSCLRSLVNELLEAASKSQFKSIAIPAIGTGYLGFPHDVVASTMYTTAKEFLEKHASGPLEKVVFVVHAKDDKSVRAFKKVFSGNFEDQSSDDTVLKGKVMIGKISFEVLQADITKETTDCIVNGTNDKLDLQTGMVSKAIIKAAGNSVVQECKQKGRVSANGTAMTGAGNLKNRKICHLNVGHGNFDIKGNIKTCLQEAENYHLKSISFPALGTGQLNNSPKDMAGIMMEAIAEFTKNEPNYLREIRVCIFDKKFIDVYHEEMQRVVIEGKKSSAKGWRKMVKAVTGVFTSSKDRKTSTGGKASGVTFTSSSVDHEVVLHITYLDDSQRDKALGKIKEFCKEQEKTVTIGGWNEKDQAELIKNLDEFKEYQLQTEAQKHNVSIDIKKRDGTITLKGHEKDVNDFVLRIHNVLFTARREMQEEEEAELLAQFIQWQFENNGKYEAYPQDINIVIEKAYKQKKDRASWKEETAGGKEKEVTVYLKYSIERDEYGKKTKIRRHDLTSNSIELPKHWASMSKTERFKLVQLGSSDSEYQEVEKAFRQTVPNLRIVKIERIQNPSLWRRYAVHKQQMAKPNEQNLWHGTSDQVIPNIVANGFNRSYCGLHGIKYGHGVYFAPKAQYPVSFHQGNYCQPDANGNSFLFYNKVLVGDYTWGRKEYKEPPPKDPNNPTVRFDSCVNNMNRIDEYVIFTDTQCYPAFLMTYKLQ